MGFGECSRRPTNTTQYVSAAQRAGQTQVWRRVARLAPSQLVLFSCWAPLRECEGRVVPEWGRGFGSAPCALVVRSVTFSCHGGAPRSLATPALSSRPTPHPRSPFFTMRPPSRWSGGALDYPCLLSYRCLRPWAWGVANRIAQSCCQRLRRRRTPPFRQARSPPRASPTLSSRRSSQAPVVVALGSTWE